MENHNQQPTKQERRELRHQEKEKEQRQRQLKRLYRRVALWTIIFLGIGGVIFGMVKLAQSPASNGASVSVEVVAESDWIKGNRESKVILIEYSDFQCPACGAYHPIISQLTQELGNKVRFVYRHFPLRQIHANAELAAQAAEAAGRQGKFWEMHDIIFANQRDWSNSRTAKESFIMYAENLNLDVERFRHDLDSKEIKQKVESDYQSGIRLGVNATPTFFLNGKKIQNPRSYRPIAK